MAKANKEEQRKAPILRFKGFTDDWEQRQLGDIAYIKGRIGWKSLKQSEYVKEGPALIASKHILNGKINWNSVDHIPDWRYEESPEIMLELNDIIFSKDGSIGNPAVITLLPNKATINSTMMLVRLNKNILSSSFFYQILVSNQFKKLVFEKTSGSSIPHIFQNDMKKFKFYFPQQVEQEKISSLLNILDNLIALYEQKYRQLQALKCGLLQNIFNNFSAINTVRLNQICALKQWKTISSQKMKKKGYPVFGANGIIGYYDRYNHEKPTICITCRGATSGNILISKPYSYITGNAMCLENLSPDFNIKFLYEYLSYRGLEDVITGSAQPQITSSLLGIVKIPVVPLKKQKSISNVLLSLDSITNIIQIKSNYLKKIKKTLLNTMFI